MQSFRHSSFCIVYIRWGGLSNTFIYLFYLKTSKPQNLKTSKPQNLKTSLCSITTVSVSYADTFGMIQQERQNNIINILGGHSYAM